ncbi:MAG: hypothetical protein ACXADY_10590 [Candidatus Hodarchaeales archaeon]|jgi:hypothetical protein
MIEEKSQQKPNTLERGLMTTLSVEGLQTVTHEFLALLSELNHQQTLSTATTSYHLSLIQSLLHMITDLETQLSIARETLERERLINNNIICPKE